MYTYIKGAAIALLFIIIIVQTLVLFNNNIHVAIYEENQRKLNRAFVLFVITIITAMIAAIHAIVYIL